MLSALSIVALAACTTQEPAPQEAPPPAGAPATRIVFETSPIADLFFFVRARASAAAAGGTAPELAQATRAVAELDGELERFFLAWGPIEGNLRAARTAADLERLVADVPESLTLPSGKSVRLREGAQRIAAELRAAEPFFLEHLWPEHEAAIAATRERLAREFDPRQADCLAFHLECLAMGDPGLELSVVLVAEAPFPGAVTHMDREGRGVSFVAAGADEGTELFETVLHEATHSLDVATTGASALEALRARLEGAGLTRRDRALRDLPHTLMFVQSAESIRRAIDPEHRDYGDVAGYYAKLPEAAELVRAAWGDFLAGRITRDAALDRIAAGATRGGSR